MNTQQSPPQINIDPEGSQPITEDDDQLGPSAGEDELLTIEEPDKQDVHEARGLSRMQKFKSDFYNMCTMHKEERAGFDKFFDSLDQEQIGRRLALVKSRRDLETLADPADGYFHPMLNTWREFRSDKVEPEDPAKKSKFLQKVSDFKTKYLKRSRSEASLDREALKNSISLPVPGSFQHLN